MTVQKSLPRGYYPPAVVFFDEQDELDLATTKTHILRLAQGGIAGVVVQGSNGEAIHLSRSEKLQVLDATRDVLRSNGYGHLPLIAGTGAASTKETLELCRDASAHGANFGLVLPPAYYPGQYPADVLKSYFFKVADESPIPILIYNFPAVTNGTNLNSDLLKELAAHPNIVGVKLTCGEMGKLTRLAKISPTQDFSVFAGKSEILLYSLVSAGAGGINALVNLVPKVHGELLKSFDAGNMERALYIQTLLSEADWVQQKLGVAGLKSSVDHFFHYGGKARHPIATPNEKRLLDCMGELKEIVELERSL